MTSPNSVHPSLQGLDGSPGEKGAPGDVGGPVSGETEDVRVNWGAAEKWLNEVPRVPVRVPALPLWGLTLSKRSLRGGGGRWPVLEHCSGEEVFGSKAS